MSQRNIARIFQAASGVELETAPIRHSLRTPQCPPLTRFVEGVQRGWTEEERDHVSNCVYCQKITAMQWRTECPSVFVLIQDIADPKHFPDRQALHVHLKEDNCRRCNLALSSRVLAGLATLIRARKSLEHDALAMGRHLGEVQGAVSFAKNVSPINSDGGLGEPNASGNRSRRTLQELTRGIVLGHGEMAIAGTFATRSRPPFQLREVSADGSLIAILRETDEGQLELNVESRIQGNAGRKVAVEILGSRAEPLRAELVLEDMGEFGSMARHAFGPMQEFAERLADCILVASWV